MRALHRGRCALVLGSTLLATLASVQGAGAQNRAKIEIVPNAPHSNEVLSVAFSPDGARLLSGGSDTTLKIWDTTSGQLIRSFAHPRGITSVAFAPGGVRLLSACADGVLRLWDAESG